MAETQAAARPATNDRVADRLPIFSALNVLGMSYAEIGRHLGVTTVSVHEWARGKKPLPLVRHLALLFLVGRLTAVIGVKHPPNTRYARRSEIAIEAARKWAELAREEIAEDTQGVYQAEELERAIGLGQRIVHRLESQ
jgi:hypothetical protein